MTVLRLFYSYSSRDETLRKELDSHLAPLQDDGLISAWSCRAIPAGSEWDPAIHEELAAADIILLLVSADFLESRYIRSIELARALDRHRAGKAVVVPVILRPCDWKTQRFAKLQAVPANGKPVTSNRSRDSAWTDVVLSIRKVAESILAKRGPVKPPKPDKPDKIKTGNGPHPPDPPPNPPRLLAQFERKVSSPHKLVTHTYEGLRHYSIRMYIKDAPRAAQTAKYKLHRTFRPRIHEVSRSNKSDFTDWIESYGDFEVKVTFVDAMGRVLVEISDYLTEALKARYKGKREEQIAQAIDAVREN